MKLRRFLPPALAAASLFACPCLLSAQEAAPVVPAAAELTLQQCITRALAKNFDLEIQRYSPQIAKESIDVARAGYQPVVTATTSVSGSHQDATLSTPEFSSHNRSTRVGVTQQLYTGTTLGVSSQLDRSRTNPAGSLNPAYDADLTLSVRQQLLKGFGTAVNMAGVNRARLGLDRANLDYKSQVLSVINATETAYYAVVFTREQLGVRKFALALAERFHEESKTRKQTGVATDLDVLTAEVGVANARRNVLLAQQSVKDSEENLLTLIGQFQLDESLGAMRFTEIDVALPVFASSYNLAKQNQPDFLSTQLAIEQAKLDLKVAKDGSRPSLSVGGAVGMSGRRASGGSAISDALDRDNNSWQLDLSLSYPWGQIGDKARYRQSLATLSQQQARLRQLEQDIEAQVRSAIRAVETNSESVKISSQARILSDRLYDFEKERFDHGLSTPYRVLQAQNDLENARVAELQANVALRNAIASLRRIEGSSLQRYSVTLP
jgi:outer membrane protein TolC